MKLSKALTWDDLAKHYKSTNGRSAQTLPMDTIFNWAEKQTYKFKVSDNGSIHEIL